MYGRSLLITAAVRREYIPVGLAPASLLATTAAAIISLRLGQLMMAGGFVGAKVRYANGFGFGFDIGYRIAVFVYSRRLLIMAAAHCKYCLIGVVPAFLLGLFS